MLEEESTSVSKTEVRSSLGSAPRILVTDPVTVGGVVPPFVLYTVRHTPLAQLERSVERRYRDFEWLHACLREDHPECVVPPLPGKQTLGRFDETFVETRRKALQTFLNRVVAHPKLSRSRVFSEVFLLGSDLLLSQTRQRRIDAKASEGHWLARGIAGFVKSSSKAIIVAAFEGVDGRKYKDLCAAPPAPRSTLRFSQGTDMFDEMLADALDLRHAAADIGPANTRLSMRSCELSVGQARLGQATGALGVACEELALRELCMDFGTLLAGLSSLSAGYAQRDYEYLEQPLLEHCGFAEAAHLALAVRRRDKEEYLDQCGHLLVRTASVERRAKAGPGLLDSGAELKLANQQMGISVQTKGQLRRKQELVARSDALLLELTEVRATVGAEAQEVLSLFAARRVEHAIRARRALASFLQKHDPDGEGKAQGKAE